MSGDLSVSTADTCDHRWEILFVDPVTRERILRRCPRCGACQKAVTAWVDDLGETRSLRLLGCDREAPVRTQGLLSKMVAAARRWVARARPCQHRWVVLFADLATWAPRLRRCPGCGLCQKVVTSWVDDPEETHRLRLLGCERDGTRPPIGFPVDD